MKKTTSVKVKIDIIPSVIHYKILFFIFFLIIVFFSGCTKTIYLDNPTPPGSVPPVSSSKSNMISPHPINKMPPVDTYRQEYGEELIVSNQDESPQEDEIVQYEKESLYIKNHFASLYSIKKKPRIAIFINRNLSDMVNSWSTNSRFIARGDGMLSMSDSSGDGAAAGLGNIAFVSGQSGRSSKIDVALDNGYIVLNSQTKNNLQGERISVRESILWEIENGFIQPFLKAKSKIIDRNTIIRLITMKYNTNSLENLPENNIEMKALREYADIYVELLVNNSDNGAYLFKAIAKEINTGRILAMANFSDKFVIKSAPRQEIVTSEQGFHVVEKQTIKTFNFEELGNGLAVNLMDSFNNLWE